MPKLTPSWWAVVLSPALSLSLVACSARELAADEGDDGGAAADAGGGAIAVAFDGTWGVRFDPASGELAVARGDDVLLRLPAAAWQLGTRDDAVSASQNFDPMGPLGLTTISPPPPDLAWRSPASVRLAHADDRGLALELAYDAGFAASATVSFEANAGFVVAWQPTAQAERVGWMRLRARADATEGFYGLGESYDHVSQRGQTRAMQLELDARSETSLNDRHVPVPFVIGTRGWGLFVASRRPGVFRIAVDEADEIDATFGTGTDSASGLAFHLFADAHPLDVTRHYYAVTGNPALPARWAYGPWLWRNENADQAQAEADAKTIRDLDLAHTAIWIDRPYATAVQTFDWEKARFPDPSHLFATYAALGFRWAIWHAPYLSEPGVAPAADAAATASLRAAAGDAWPKTVGLLTNKWGRPIDLTSDGAVAFWRKQLAAYSSAPGFGGYKLDYGEDVVPGPFAARNAWLFANGETEQTMHAGYSLAYHATYAATLPADGGFLLCRHGVWGDQTNVSVVWPGDMDATFAKRGEMVDGKAQIGGFPATIVAALSLGASGFPIFAADTGGYIGGPADKELFTRWFEQSAFSVAMEVGTGASQVAWEPDAKTGFDQEMLGFYRDYLRWKLRLSPYVWSYAARLAVDGRPIARALGLAMPELGEHPDDEYLLGDRLLVAPVVERGATSRSVVFPPGTWTHWTTGDVVTGPATIDVPAPLGVIPVYLGDGGIVPMLRPTIDTLSPVADASAIDSYATDPGVAWVRVAPGAASSFDLFDGGRITADASSGALVVTTSSGTELAKGFVIELVARARPAAPPSVDGADVAEVASEAALAAASTGFAWAADAGGTLRVRVPGGSHTVRVP